MEFIQCTHCGKKYAINEKVRKFVGQEIKCKVCEKKFPIIIHIKPDTSTPEQKPEPKETQAEPQEQEEPQSQDTPEEQPSPEPSSEPTEDKKDTNDSTPISKDKSAGKLKSLGSQLQLYLTIFLAICLTAGLIFLLLMNNEEPVPVQAPQTIISDPSPPQITDKEIMTKKTKPKTKKGFSDDCKKAAAGQWLIDHNMIHGQLTNEQYMDFMDLSQEQSSKVRTICGDDNIVQQVLQAAREQIKPAWFRDEIRVLQE